MLVKRSMVAFLTQLLLAIRSRFTSRARLEAENLFLRQQLVILRRRSPTRVRLWNVDRLLFLWLYRLYPSLLDAIIIVQPETVLRWHRRGFGAYWRSKSRHVGGRPRIDSEMRALIRRIGRENPLWGAPRRTIYLPIIASLDLFVVPTISFKLLYGLVILHHARRRLVTISVTSNPTAEWIAGQVTDAFPWDEAPSHLIRDRDGAFGAAYTHRIRAMGIRDHPTAPRSPWQNGHVERLIGSIRRECLDHLVVFDEAHLRRVLKNYASYYNEVRTHLSLHKNAPTFRRPHKLGPVAVISMLGGLHHQYLRV